MNRDVINYELLCGRGFKTSGGEEESLLRGRVPFPGLLYSYYAVMLTT